MTKYRGGQRDHRHQDQFHQPRWLKACATASGVTLTMFDKEGARPKRIGFLSLFPGPGYGGSCFQGRGREVIAMGRGRPDCQLAG